VPDGQFHDQEDVIAYTKEHLAPAIIDGKFPRTVFTLVGIGSSIDEQPFEELMHVATPEEYPHREIVCYALADTLDQLPALVSHLLDENTPAFYGGAMFTAGGKTVATHEDMVPAVLTFRVPVNVPERGRQESHAVVRRGRGRSRRIEPTRGEPAASEFGPHSEGIVDEECTRDTRRTGRSARHRAGLRARGRRSGAGGVSAGRRAGAGRCPGGSGGAVRRLRGGR
jgi:hypothetical protein